MRPCTVCGEVACEHLPEGVDLCPEHLLEALAQAEEIKGSHIETGEI